MASARSSDAAPIPTTGAALADGPADEPNPAVPAELDPNAPDVWVVEPSTPGLKAQLRELWRYRYLFRFFGRKALQKRYLRTILGVWWLVIRPLFPIVISVFVFGGVMGVSAEGLPFFLFITAGIAHWRFFGASLMWGTRSLELNRTIMKQLYFPRLILPPATMAPSLVELGIYTLVLAATLVYYWIAEGVLYLRLGPALLLAPVALLFTLAFSLSVSLFTSIFGAQTRDLRFSLNYVLTFWMLLTPVVYPLSYIPEQWRWAIYLNPMAALVNTFKFALFEGQPFDPLGLLAAVAFIAVLLPLGLRFFNHADATSVDRL